MSEGAVTFFVAVGEEFVPRLFAELGVPIRSVSVSRPTLDDVFMSYTGTTIRDAEESGGKHAQPGDDADDDRGPPMSATEQAVAAPPSRPTSSASASRRAAGAASCARSRSSGAAS